MRLARYHKGAGVRIEDAPIPDISESEILVKTAACGLCSGELMDWYMNEKAPHVLGHEVSGHVAESKNDKFPVGALVTTHHHTSCGECDDCKNGNEVHCAQWKNTRLHPGGMSEYFRIAKENLSETFVVNDLHPQDAALLEPIACVCKSISRAQLNKRDRVLVLGLGALGRLHLLLLLQQGFQPAWLETRPERAAWAEDALGGRSEPKPGSFDAVFVLPGSPEALKAAAEITAPGGRIILFAPLTPGQANKLDFSDIYFRDISLVPSYSCGKSDIKKALQLIRGGAICAEKVVSDFISLHELPQAYERMKRGEILKAMVVF